VCCHALCYVNRLSHIGAAGRQASNCVESLAAGLGPALGVGGCVGCEHRFAWHVGGVLCTAVGRQGRGSAKWAFMQAGAAWCGLHGAH
jgi:hypothetical protein